MIDLGNRLSETTISFCFNSHLADGTPSTFSNSPQLAVAKAGTGTQTISGISLDTDVDSIVGLNEVTIDLSASIFYAAARDYVIRVQQGTVNGIDVSGVVIATFSIENRAGGDGEITAFSASALGQLSAIDVSVQSPVATDGLLSIVQGDDYAASENRQLSFMNIAGTWPDLTGATVALVAQLESEFLQKAGTVISSTAPQQVDVELTHEESSLTPGYWDYHLEATLDNGNVITLQIGRMQVVPDLMVA